MLPNKPRGPQRMIDRLFLNGILCACDLKGDEKTPHRPLKGVAERTPTLIGMEEQTILYNFSFEPKSLNRQRCEFQFRYAASIEGLRLRVNPYRPSSDSAMPLDARC
jgi:hypothetical protein